MSGPRPPRGDDAIHLRAALRLARRGEGRVEPNPMVGCVIVRGHQVIGRGWHRRFGGAHAEIEALRQCGAAARGATVYVSLEPCCIHGKTPPCTDALIAAGVRRVVAAVRDPNPRVSGRGFAALRRAGIEVECGLLENEGAALIAPFSKRMQTGRPWVILKWAQSIDGVIATHAGDSRWISDEAARAHAHRVRARLDAIIVGSQTVLRDDPMLTARGVRPRRVATRVVLDSTLRTPLSSQLVRTAHLVPTLICCGARAAAARVRQLEAAGCEVRRVAADAAGLRLDGVLEYLGARGMTNVLLEGGGRLLGTAIDQQIADEVHVYLAPRLIGGREAVHALNARGAARVADSLWIEEPRMRSIGNGWLLTGRPSPRPRRQTSADRPAERGRSAPARR